MEIAFLEFARPTIEQAIEQLVRAGVRRVLCQPGMLFASGHVKNDLPKELERAKRRWSDVELLLTDAIDIHDKLLELCQLRWNEAMSKYPTRPAQDTMLLLAG